MSGKGKDWIRNKTREVMKAFLSRQPGNVVGNSLNPVEYITFTNGDKTKGVTDSGINVDTIPQGRLRQREMGIMVGPKQYLCKGQPVRYMGIDGSINNAYVIGKDPSLGVFVGSLTDNEMVLHHVDAAEILGTSFDPSSGYVIEFSKDSKHIFIGEVINEQFSGDITDPLSGFITVHYGWGLNFRLTTNESMENVVSFSEILNFTINLGPDTLPNLPPPSAPGLPVNREDPTPGGISVFFELEPDTDIVNTYSTSLQLANLNVSYNNYINSSNLPQTDVYGGWTVSKTTSSMFRPTNSIENAIGGNPEKTYTIDSYGSLTTDPDLGQVREYVGTLDDNVSPPVTATEHIFNQNGSPPPGYIFTPGNLLSITDSLNSLHVSTNVYDLTDYNGVGPLYALDLFWTNETTLYYSFVAISNSISSDEVGRTDITWTSEMVDVGGSYRHRFTRIITNSGNDYKNSSAWKSKPKNSINIIALVGGPIFNASLFTNLTWVHPADSYFSSTPSETVGPGFELIAFTDTHYFIHPDQTYPPVWVGSQLKAIDSEVFQTYNTSGSITIAQWSWSSGTNGPIQNKIKTGQFWNTGLYSFSVSDWTIK